MSVTPPLASELPSAPEGLSTPEHNHASADSAHESSAFARGTGALSAAPRIVITGGNSFPSESLQEPSAALAHIDWFAFTVTPPDGGDLLDLFPDLVKLFDLRDITSTGKGWSGYDERYNLGDAGLLAHGGHSQRGSIHVELNATGCARVADWGRVMEWGIAHKATITRIDLAHDDLDGKTVSIENALQWLKAGDFATNGRPPDSHLRDDLGSGKGKTLYVGNRKNGKLCRIYEKGRQLGDPSSPWVRAEVEFRNKSRVIPWDILINPDPYLAGAYPCLAFLSETQIKIRTISEDVKISYARAVYHGNQMVGKLINVMMQFHGGDALAVVNKLRRDGIPRRLENHADFLPRIIAGDSA
jgi:phage replication initiation protein